MTSDGTVIVLIEVNFLRNIYIQMCYRLLGLAMLGTVRVIP